MESGRMPLVAGTAGPALTRVGTGRSGGGNGPGMRTPVAYLTSLIRVAYHSPRTCHGWRVKRVRGSETGRSGTGFAVSAGASRAGSCNKCTRSAMLGPHGPSRPSSYAGPPPTASAGREIGAMFVRCPATSMAPGQRDAAAESSMSRPGHPARGLSPRVRANQMRRQEQLTRAGSIPACAGEPQAICRPHRSATVYPRVCGGTVGSGTTIAVAQGLSPRVRGNPHEFGVILRP